jgi:hypothetical protein
MQDKQGRMRERKVSKDKKKGGGRERGEKVRNFDKK